MEDYRKKILKTLDRFQYSRGRREVFLDVVEYVALTVATQFDPFKQEERNNRMQEIVANYKGNDGTTFCALLTDMLSYLKRLPKSFGDYLGDMYMEIEAGNKNAGQYFTPYDVSRLIAEVTISEPTDKDQPITLCEPCCGSGGMALAAAEVLQNYGFNYADKLLVVANDIDRHCVLMAYTQLSFAAIPAIIKWQDTLTQKTWDAFVTPAFALQFDKFSRIYHGKESQM